MTWLHRASLAIWLTLAALGAAGSAHAQESAVVKRATQLRDAPADTGASVAPLEADTTVTRSNERKGAWTRVTTPQGATGWVHMFDLGPASGSATASNNSATSGLRGLGNLLGGNSGSTTTATSTVGIRGLGAEDIANAQPNPAAVSRAEGLRVSADQARQFAANASLQPRAVAALAAPAAPPSSGSGGATPWSTPASENISPN